MGRAAGTLGVLLGVLVLAGCGSTDEPAVAASPSSVPVSTPPRGPGELQLREVRQVRESGGTCPTSPPSQPAAAEPATLCDEDGREYRLEPAAWAGTVTSAEAEIPHLDVQWVLNVDLPGDGATALAEFTTEHAGDGTELALLLDGGLLSTTVANAPITDGKFQLVGGYTEKAAQELADRLTGR